jgi:asparagine synthase (glutamine-hydrolysing)
MCGIAGVLFSNSARLPEMEDLRAMSAAILHRGPDGEGFRAESGVGLIHRRLSIIDLAGGAQPMGNEDGTVQVVFNGEIYNYTYLRAELEREGHRFRTQSDTEVLVHLYEERGERMVERLRGMFAFAIWDRRKRRLFVARDRIGIKPLYFYRDEEKFLFASEPKAILAYPGFQPEIDHAALEDYLAYGNVPGPRSIFKGITKLPPGHTLVIEPGRLGAAPRRYWRLKFEPDDSLTSEEWQEAVHEKFQEAVRVHMTSDVPVGAFLSGGLDSSAVVAAASRQSSRPLKTFSIGFNEAGFDELPYARAVAQYLHTEHTERIQTMESERILDGLTQYYDEPFADASAIPTFLVARTAAQHVKVVLTGDGGDEAFGGYSRYAHDLRESALRQWLPGWIRRSVVGPMGRAWPQTPWLPRPLRFKSTLTHLAMEAGAAHANSISQCRQPLRRRLMAPGIIARLVGHDPALQVRLGHLGGPAGDDLAGMLAADVNTVLPDDFLVKVDRATMAAGLEARPPLLDHELLELAARIPSRFKVRGGETKWLFKQVCLKSLPREIVYRKKHGFDVPVSAWLRGPLRNRFVDTVLAPNGAIGSMIDRSEVQRLFVRHQKGAGGLGQILWSFLILADWAERYLAPTPLTGGYPALPLRQDAVASGTVFGTRCV